MKNNFLVVCFFLGIFAFQSFNIDSDPSFIVSWGTMMDEGFWQHNARMKVIYGDYTPDDLKMSYLGAPLFNNILYWFYQIFDISLKSARYVSLISFWLILLMTFLMLIDKYDKNKSLAIVMSFGIFHEILVYAKWSTPNLLEMVFLVGIIFFYLIWLKNKKNINLIFSGLSYGLAILAKLTSVLFIVPLVIFFFFEFKRKKINLRGLIFVFYGILIVIIPFLLFFVLENLNGYFNNLFEYSEWRQENNSGRSIFKIIFLNILFSPINLTIFKSPSAFIMIIFTNLYFLNLLLKKLINKETNILKKLDSIEIFSMSWIIGLIFILCLTSQNALIRREIQLFFPFFILSISYLFSRQKTFRVMEVMKPLNICLLILVSICISHYISNIYLNSIYDLIHEFDILGSFVKYSRTRYLIPFILIFIFHSIIYGSKNLSLLLVSIFFINNIILNSIWYLRPSYTLKDISSYTEKKSNSITYTSRKGFWYCINKNVHPIWYDEGKKINKTFIKNINKEKIFIFSDTKINLEQKNYKLFDKNLNIKNISFMKKLEIIPIPFTKKFKDELFLYLYDPKY